MSNVIQLSAIKPVSPNAPPPPKRSPALSLARPQTLPDSDLVSLDEDEATDMSAVVSTSIPAPPSEKRSRKLTLMSGACLALAAAAATLLAWSPVRAGTEQTAAARLTATAHAKPGKAPRSAPHVGHSDGARASPHAAALKSRARDPRAPAKSNAGNARPASSKAAHVAAGKPAAHAATSVARAKPQAAKPASTAKKTERTGK